LAVAPAGSVLPAVAVGADFDAEGGFAAGVVAVAVAAADAGTPAVVVGLGLAAF
jgi:hypothetical protein